MDVKTSLMIGPRTGQHILKGRVIRKLKNGADVFEDYWTDSDGESSTLSEISNFSSKQPEELLNIESAHLDGTSGYKNFSSSQTTRHSSKKFKEALLMNDSVDSENAGLTKKGTCAADFEDITINLGVDDNCETVIPELQSIDNSPLSQIYDKNNEAFKVTSNINIKNSKKSIARSVKKDAKIKELQLQYDEYDEKIMRMVHTNDDENIKLSVTSEEDVHLTLQPFNKGEMAKGSKVKKKVLRTSKYILGKEIAACIESQNEKLSPNKRTAKNTSKSEIKNNPDSESFRNWNNTISQDHMIEKEKAAANKNSDSNQLQTSKRQMTRNNSESEENDVTNISMNSVNSVNSASEVKTFQKQKEIESNKNKQTATNKNDFMAEENGFEAPESNELFKVQASKNQKTRNVRISSESEENDVANTSINSENSANDASEVKTFKKQGKIESNKNRQTATNKNDFMPEENGLETSKSNELFQVQTSKKRKTRHVRISSESEENDVANTSINSVNSVNGASEVKTFKKQKKIESNKNRLTARNKKSHLMPEENGLQTSESNDLFQKQTSKKQKTRNVRISSESEENDIANTSMNSVNSINFASEGIIKKTHKRSQKIKKDKNKQETATNKRSCFLPDENILEAADYDDLSLSQTSKRQTTRSNSASEENDKSKQKTATNKPGVKKTSKSQKKNIKSKSRCVGDENDPEGLHSANAHEQLNHATIIRRSIRQKFAPLARWRNERLLYRFENGEIKTMGIEKGTKEDTAFMKQLYNVVHGRQNKKVKKISRPRKAKILDITEQRQKILHVHKKFPLVSWNSPVSDGINKNSKQGYLIKRMFDTNRNSFGYLQIDVGETKPPQFMPKEDLQLTVVTGKLEIGIQKNVYIVESKDMFIVPCGTAYTIKNIGNIKALLAYVVGKFRFLNEF